MRYDSPFYLAKYARDNELMDKPGWKQLPCYFKKNKKTNNLIQAAKTKVRRNTVNIKFGMNIPYYHK